MHSHTVSPTDLLRRTIDWGLILAALGIVLILILRAAVSIDTSHDTWWYHLPWAARLAGLMPADVYVFDDFLEQRYAGFPVLMEWLQGQLWRLTGRPESANFLALASLGLFVAFLRLRFLVPAHLALLALIAVPLIHIHATADHVDLPANLSLAAAILLLIPLYSRTAPPRPGDLALFALACAATAHAKLPLIPIVALVFVSGLVALVLARRRAAHRPPLVGPRTLAWAVAIALVAGGIFYTPIKNTVRFGNPVYPMALRIGPWTLDGPQGSYLSHTARGERLMAARAALAGPVAPGGAGDRQASPATAQARTAPADAAASYRLSILGSPLAWVHSVLEIGMEPVLGRGQWTLLGTQHPPLPERFGGFFGWYVVFHLALLAVLIARAPRARVGILVLFLAATLVAALAPSQTMLRYYMFWMVLLVSLNLILLRSLAGSGPASRGASCNLGRLVGAVGLAAFLLTVYATRAEFFKPRFYFLEDMIAVRRDARILAAVAGHPASCLAGERAPRMFLYAPLFDGGKAYRLKMGPIAGDPWEQLAAACGPGWTPVVAVREDAGLLPPVRPR
jgi:hypothetical protein